MLGFEFLNIILDLNLKFVNEKGIETRKEYRKKLTSRMGLNMCTAHPTPLSRATHLLPLPFSLSSGAYTWAHWPDSVSTRIGLGVTDLVGSRASAL
jgi:hypothetical protein